MGYNHWKEELDYCLAFTAEYRKHETEDCSVREAKMLRFQYPAILCPIKEHDLFAGRIRMPAVGFSPKDQDSYGYYFREQEIKSWLERPDLAPGQKEQIEGLLSFWRKRNAKQQVRALFTEKQKELMPTDDLEKPGIAFPLYRMTGWVPDYRKLMEKGLPGLRREAEESREKRETGTKEYCFYTGILEALKTVADCAEHYRREAEREIRHIMETYGFNEPDQDDAFLKNKGESQRENEAVIRIGKLRKMERRLFQIQHRAPADFGEGIQLFWLYSLLGYTLDYGRLDDFLADLYEKSHREDGLTQEDALEELVSLWVLMADMATTVHGRVVIGGRGRKNVFWADQLALLAMEASRIVLRIEPQLTLRLYEGMNRELLEKAFEVIGEGRTYPLLYWDEVNIPSVQNAMQVSEKEAEDYYPFGCGEYVLAHKSFGTPNGVLNVLQAVMEALYAQAEGEEFHTLYHRFLVLCNENCRALAKMERQAYDVAGTEASYLLLSPLYDGCMERGRGIFQGGIPYLGGTLETYGNVSAYDSLFGIKELVYVKKRMTLRRLKEVLSLNFVGCELEYAQIKRVPKFGNDDKEADRFAAKVHEDLCAIIRNQAVEVGLHSYLAVLINNDHNVKLGKAVAASPDGRKKGQPMSNGSSPTAGNDQTGLTAVMNSVVRLRTDLHAGGVTNFKLSRQLLRENKTEIIHLFEDYFKQGGQQAMISVVDQKELQRAMEFPEEYQNLFVRVGGYSARFIKLPREVQQDIANRTLYERYGLDKITAKEQAAP